MARENNNPHYRHRIHFYVDGSDLTHCGKDPFKVKYTEAPAEVNCQICRRTLVEHEGKYFMLCRWTTECSGCTNSEDGHVLDGPHGCRECGYTGRRRREELVALEQ